MRTSSTRRCLLLAVTLLGLAGCGRSGVEQSGGGGGSASNIEVFTLNGAVTASGNVAMGIIAQTANVAVPVMIRNSGTAVLNITGPVTVTPTNGTASVRDAPPATVAAGDTGAMTILLTAGTSGNPSAQISIPSDAPGQNPFVFTVTFTLATSTRALYTSVAGAVTNLISSTFPGVASTATVNGAVTTGTGVGQHFHLLDRALFTNNTEAGVATDLFLRGLGAAAPALPLNLTSSITSPTGFFGTIQFTSGDNVLFTYNSGANPTRLFSLAINGAVAGLPTEISGALPPGSPTGVQLAVVSPRKDQVAFLGDFLTAGTQEIFLVPVAGGARARISDPLVARTITPGSIRWLPDQSDLVYETFVTLTGQQREINLIRLGSPVVVTRLNGAVPAGRTGVIPDKARLSNTGTRVFFVSDELGALPARELFVVSLIGGSLSAAVGLNGGTIAGASNGVGDFSINHAGTKLLFTADSGPANQVELFQSLIADSTPTTTKIVASPANFGVRIDGARSVFSDTIAWYTRDDVVSGRQELFFLDMATASPTSTRIVNTATFPPGPAGVPDVANVFPQANGRVVFTSDRSTPGGTSRIFSATLSSAPGTIVLNALRNFVGVPVVLGDGVAFEGDLGAAPQEVFFNLITGGAEIQIDGGELAGSSSGVQTIVLFSSSRVFYHFFTATFDQEWNASTAAPADRQRTDTAGVASAGTLRLGIEPR